MLAAPLFAGLGGTDLENDEAIYAEVVERMVAGGSWVTPTDQFGPFLEKPPLRFWMVAAPMALGVLHPTEAGHRLVDATLSAGALLYVFLIARRLGGTASGLGAAFLTITQTHLLFTHGLRSGTVEPLLVLSYCGAIDHFMRWAAGAGRRHAIVTGLWCAIAVLAKFVGAAPLFVLLAAGAASAPPWRARAVADARVWAKSAALFVAVAMPWFLFQAARLGLEAAGATFFGHVVTRVGAYLDPVHLQPWWFYPLIVYETLHVTWPYFVGGLLALAWRARTRPQPEATLVALWLVVPVVLFSFATSKLAHYIYPALPAVAVIGGQVFGAAVALVGDVRRRAPVSPRVRMALAVLGASALVLAVIVMVRGRVDVALGPLDVRTGTPARPAVVGAAALLACAGRRRAAAALLGAALAVSEVDREHGRALARARAVNRPLGTMAECLASRSGGGGRRMRVTVGRGLTRDERYYLDRVGIREQGELDTGQLARRLRDPERDVPVVLGSQEYRALWPRLAEWTPEARASTTFAPIPGHDMVILLPGRFRPCALPPRGEN